MTSPRKRASSASRVDAPVIKPQIVKVGPKGVITIPEENRRAMALEPGKYLTVMQVGRSLILSPEINDFLGLAEQFQEKLAQSGETPEGLLGDLVDARRELYEGLFGGPSRGPKKRGA